MPVCHALRQVPVRFRQAGSEPKTKEHLIIRQQSAYDIHGRFVDSKSSAIVGLKPSLRIHLWVHAIWQWIALDARDQILGRHPGHFLAGPFPGAGDVRRDDEIIQS